MVAALELSLIAGLGEAAEVLRTQPAGGRALSANFSRTKGSVGIASPKRHLGGQSTPRAKRSCWGIFCGAAPVSSGINGTFGNSPSWCGSERRSCVMKNMVLSLALGAGAIFAFSAADAAPLTKGLAMLPNDNIENVRLVCDQAGQCYRTRGGRRVIYGDGYGGGYGGGYDRGYYGGGPGYYGGGPG